MVNQQSTEAKSVDLAEVYVFTDRSDADLEFVYAIRDNEVFALKHLFPAPPGHDQARWYSLRPLPPALLRQAKVWRTRPGVTPPSWQSGDMWFGCVKFPRDSGAPQQVVYFPNENTEFEAFMTELRRAVICEDNSVSQIPDWTRSDKRVLIWVLPEGEREALMRRLYGQGNER
ncbi:MAG: hypothetical protein NTX87_08925 [Planctomycetota bacterium]|nr:hypothetical protein [Planctomycetota bacterium]